MAQLDTVQQESSKNDTLKRYDSLNLSSKTIMITGAAGFIGSNLVAYFAQNHPKCKILALDYFRDELQFSNGNPKTLGHFKNLVLYPNVEVLPLDIASLQDIRYVYKNNSKIDYIFHQAAVSDTTCMDMKHILHVNLQAFKNLIKLALQHNSHIIYASSAAVYGNTKAPNSVGINEIPENIYGYSKLCMDRENVRFQELLQKRGVAIIGLRYFNVYGRNEFYKHKTSSMILQLALQALQNKVVKLFEFGEQQRDFVYIEDVIAANMKALEIIELVYGLRDSAKQTLEWQRIHKTFNDVSMPKEPPLQEMNIKTIFGNTFKEKAETIMQEWLQHGAIYNVGFGISRSYNDIVEILKKELQIECNIEYIKNPYPFFQNHTLADSHNFLPNYTPRYTLEDGIKDYVPHIQTIYEDIMQGKKIW